MRFLNILFLASLAFAATVARADSPGFEARRREVREWVMRNAENADTGAVPTIAPAENDQATNLVDRFQFDNLARMEQAGLLQAQLPESPWSDFYWPTYAGQLANRYNDPGYRGMLIWKDNAEYLTKMLGRGTQAQLSPAEKYDLLVGDRDFTLTRRMINAGAPYADEKGEVPSWFGICHGWAPASFMLPRAAHAVKAVAASGREVEFSPSDMKALASLLWANSQPRTRFVGGRCNDKNVDRGPGDREVNPDCFDTNPATWHLVAVNQLGVSKRSFVMDASAGMEVWNQPLYGYRYAYIHPVTGVATEKLADAKIRLADYSNDPYRASRSSEAVSVVKVVMTVDYISETLPTAEREDSALNDNHTVVNYSYDLELAADDRIVGGEWYSSVHPDFLWLPTPDSQARSVGDAALDRANDRGEWKAGQALPAAWRQAAKLSAQREQPLARIVQELLNRAK